MVSSLRLVYATSFIFLGQSVAVRAYFPFRGHLAQQAALQQAEITTSSPSATESAGATTSIISATSTASELFPCFSEIQEIEDSLPTDPPGYSSFSNSYYESHPRTADLPELECAWFSELPEDLDDETLKTQNETEEWFHRLESGEDPVMYDKLMDFVQCAIAGDLNRFPCQEEYDSYVLEVEERAETSGVHGKGVSRFAGLPVVLLVGVGVSVLAGL